MSNTTQESVPGAAPGATAPADVAPAVAPTSPAVPEPTGPGTAVAAQEQLRSTDRTILTEDKSPSTEQAVEGGEKADAPATAFDAGKITFPEGFVKNDELFGKFTEIATANKLSLPAAQQLADLYTTAAKAAGEANRTAWNTTLASWETEVKADTELAKATLRTSEGVLQGLDAVKAIVGRVIDNPTLTHPKFREALEVTGLGSHPAAVRTIYQWARMLSEGGAVAGNGPAPEPGRAVTRPDAASALYPNNPRGGAA